MDKAVAARLGTAFARGSGHGLLQLGGGEVGQALPPVFVWWRGFASRYVAALCQHGVGADMAAASPATAPEVPPSDAGELISLVLTAPMMAGAEYLTPDVLRLQWAEIGRAVAACLAIAGVDLQSFLQKLNPAWNLVGRVHFNLAENRRDPDAPFAFMATYTTRLSAQARAQHLPLGQALREYADAASRGKLLSLLLLVAPASLLANWAAEIERFAPDLKARIVHPSAMNAEAMKQFTQAAAAELDLAITSYGTLLRMPVLAETVWRLVILDEAQAVKNPNAKQTRAAKALKAQARIALTGTPVENSLGDLWSIFDVINPGLLGGAKQFATYTKRLAERGENPYGPLRELVRPYILRRMKTDRSVIADLPDKIEIKAHCHLSRKQAALYAQAVEDLQRSLKEADGIQRKGVVLAMLMRLKQICNHPSQWLGDGGWAEADSGKLARLREIAEVAAARQEKMLVFTQFREATAPLAAFLGGIFGRSGLVLHGATAVKQRAPLVQRFQDDESVPFFVLSLKAGGAGLTLTAASHVVHFDRWWNPAVENQATDRAFRIGQKKNVLVHKFVCRGTIEDRIDAMLEAKQGLSDALLTGAGEVNLTEMTDAALLQLVALDLSTAMKD